ncbi:MAG: DUF2971 domain-containing protein [Candidatus Poribacteria bacterium]|nr:DUF2971 domain-containing protein [Candidatus Poribacteria bacterium]
MAEFFRFRSVDALLGKHQELQTQTIYFASPEELDDPMEGLRDIIWIGDEIVWTNFLKHYVFCMHRSYFLLQTAKKFTTIDVDSMPIFERWDQLTIPLEQIIFDDIWNRFYHLPNVPEIIAALANTKRKIRNIELASYLRFITFVLIDEIQKSHIDHKLTSEFVGTPFSEKYPVDIALESLCNFIKNNETIENVRTFDALFQLSERDIARLSLLVPQSINSRNIDILIKFNIAKVYLEQLEKLLWPKWYTACFTKSYHNSSVWANYTDGHQGVCLIFEAAENDNLNSLELNEENTKSSRTFPFHEVHYADRPGEIDFFRTICRITMSTLKELWYTGQDGTLSECAAHIKSKSDEDDWKESYWKNFFRDVTTKIKDWAHEQEYRLVLEDGLSQFNEKGSRKLTYDFNSLKGIIFGMKTSVEDKRKIIEIINDKNRAADFNFFQAFYSSKYGDIRKYKLGV